VDDTDDLNGRFRDAIEDQIVSERPPTYRQAPIAPHNGIRQWRIEQLLAAFANLVDE
jgi:hypothetical protein